MFYNQIQFVGYQLNTLPTSDGVATYTSLYNQCKTVDMDPYDEHRHYVGLYDEKEDYNLRCGLMEEAVIDAYKAQNINREEHTLKVFVAPEFYFRGRRGAYSIKTYGKIVDRLRGFVRQLKYKNWLFIFGSIVCRLDDARREMANIVFVQKGNSGEEGARVVVKEHMSKMDFLQRSNDSNLTLDLVSEHVNYLPAGLKKTLNSRGKPTEIIYDANRGKGKEQQKWSYDGAGIFTIDGITFGVELCVDHRLRRLWRSPVKVGQNRVMVQIIPSAGMAVLPQSVVAKLDGLVFNCDGAGTMAHTYLYSVTKKIDLLSQHCLGMGGYLHLHKLGVSEANRNSMNLLTRPVHITSDSGTLHRFVRCFQMNVQPTLNISYSYRLPKPEIVGKFWETQNPNWVPDSATDMCWSCKKKIVEKKHCHICGRVFCYKCVKWLRVAPSYGYTCYVGMCKECFTGKNGLLPRR